MMFVKKVYLVLVVALATISLTGCLVDIKNDVDYPAEQFKQTLKKIEKIHAQDPGRKGEVHNLNFLIYIGDERKLVSLSFPKALLEGASNYTEMIEDDDFKKNTEVLKDIDIKKQLKKLENLDAIGPGLILEAQIAKDNIHIIIWID
jgi:hypothetical protein